ncbi:MAG: hypothetical protein A2Z49_08680 [Chloroflexi bacterium RBG_19FT_COMBO_56_12]|nr:MAG: hypothetical protein A2Z49_08680 [Chloroflexi bacterium RBG_19FT_COMBO_56_12]
MSKKRKRQIRSTTYSEKTSAPAVGSVIRSAQDEFNPNYTPVIKDLRRIGLLAGSFLVILVVLAFFLT